MQAIREIRYVDSESISIRIPKKFRKNRLEIIVLPYGEVKPSAQSQKEHRLKQFDLLVENTKKRNVKVDKEIDIDTLMVEMYNQ